MEIKETSKTYNPVFKRRELSFFIDHTSLGSPKLHEVRKALAEKYGVGEEAVYVTKLDTRTGTNSTRGEAEVYDSPETAMKVVPKHIQNRNAPSRRGKKEAKGPSPAEKK